MSDLGGIMLVTLIIWVGLFAYVYRVDRRVRPDSDGTGARLLGRYWGQCHFAPGPGQHSAEEWASLFPPNPIMGEMPRYSIIGGVTDHTAHHRGALTVYQRLLELTPLMPYMEA